MLYWKDLFWTLTRHTIGAAIAVAVGISLIMPTAKELALGFLVVSVIVTVAGFWLISQLAIDRIQRFMKLGFKEEEAVVLASHWSDLVVQQEPDAWKKPWLREQYDLFISRQIPQSHEST